MPKRAVYQALKAATSHCQKSYAKGETSFDMLERLDPARVEAACPHAKALLDRLRSIM